MALAGMEQGWNESLDRLEEFMANEPITSDAIEQFKEWWISFSEALMFATAGIQQHPQPRRLG